MRVRATPRVPSPLAHLRRRLHAIAETARDREKNARDRELRVHLFRARCATVEIEGRTPPPVPNETISRGDDLVLDTRVYVCEQQDMRYAQPQDMPHTLARTCYVDVASVAGAVTPHPGEEVTVHSTSLEEILSPLGKMLSLVLARIVCGAVIFRCRSPATRRGSGWSSPAGRPAAR